MAEPEFMKVPGDGVQIQVACSKGEGADVVCVHGLTANCRCWDRIAQALAPGHQVWAIDLRGRGFSDKPETGYSLEHHCRVIEAVMRGLGIERAAVMGHSLGAAIAAFFAATRPELTTKAVLVDGAGQLAKEQTEKVLASIKMSLERLGKVFPDYQNYVENLKKAPFFSAWNEYLDAYFRYETEAVDGGVRSRVYPEAIQKEIENLKELRIGEYYGRIACPVLILRATEGILAPDDLLLPEDAAARMEKEIRHATRVDIAGSNHYTLLFDAFDSRDKAIKDFLAA